jgi:hypothetical protein
MLLILSAIDLLSSALICGFLLFVTLVGADANNANATAETDGSGDGYTVLELLSVSDSVNLKNHVPDNENKGPAESDIEKRFFKAAEVSSKGYLIPNRFRSVTLADLGQEVSIRVYPSGQEPIELFLRCDPASGPILLILRPLTFPPSCQPGHATPPFTIDAKVLFLPKDRELPGLLNPTQTSFRATNRFMLKESQELPGAVTLWGVAL